MTDQGSPIRIEELLQLRTRGIYKGRITEDNLTMSSDKFICVCDNDRCSSQFVIIDMANPTNPVRRDFDAIHAVMNPAAKIIALTGFFKEVDLFNLETESTMKSHRMGEYVRLLKWINAETLAVVTGTAVFHWSTEGESEPRKVFAIDPRLHYANSQIRDYRCDKKLQWSLLIGLSLESPHYGAMQLYSEDRNVSQILEGHAAAFTQFKVEGNSEPSTLLYFSFRTPRGGKLHIKKLDQPPRGHQPCTEKAVNVYFPPEGKDIIPIAMQTSSKHGIIYLITRAGYVLLYDVETASLIYTSRMSDHDILVTAPHEATSGIIGVNKKGQVLSVSVDEDNLIPYIKNVLKNPDLALRMAVRNYLPGTEDLFLQKFNTLWSRGQYAEARKLAQNAPQANSSVLCEMDVQDPAGGISREDPLVQQELSDSSSLSKEAGEVGTSRLPIAPEENKVLSDLKELFLNKEDCDIVIKVRGQEFPAHKLLLKARSSVFAATFNNEMKEKATGVVNIEDCDPACFSDFLCFLYCGDTKCVSEENVFSLFKTADKYDVQDLRVTCLNFMKKNLSVDTFCDTLAIALQHSEKELIQLTTQFFTKNAPRIVLTVKWQSFLTENPIQGNELLIKLLVPNKNTNK